jgi:hypothetical protein
MSSFAHGSKIGQSESLPITNMAFGNRPAPLAALFTPPPDAPFTPPLTAPSAMPLVFAASPILLSSIPITLLFSNPSNFGAPKFLSPGCN